MKRYTKVLATFCAMAMIFGTVSANVFADETDIPQAATGAAAGDESSAASSQAESQTTVSDTVAGDPSDEAGTGVAGGAASADAGVADQGAGGQAESVQSDNVQPGTVDPVTAEVPSGADSSKTEADADNDKELKNVGRDERQKGLDSMENLKNINPGNSGTEQKAPESPSTDNNDDTSTGEQKTNTAVDRNTTRSLFANGLITQADINAYGMPTEAGNYTVAEDLTVSSGAHITLSDQIITIDLNGYTISYTGSESFYKIGEVTGVNTYSTGIVLTIKDTSANGTGKILADKSNGYTGGGSVDHWNNGQTIGPDPSEGGRGGCIQIEYTNTFVLESGEITGFIAEEDGGGVFVANASCFEMKGGKITDCSAGSGGGAVAVHASSKKNIAKGVFIMTGGEISGNKAGFGGAVRCNRAELSLFGGVITNNKATGANGGGGIYSKQANNINPRIDIKGNFQIYGNTSSNSSKANLYIDSHTKVYLAGDLSAGAKIHINGSGNTEIETGGHAYSLSSFVCDNAELSPYVTNNGNIKFSASMPKIEGYSLVIGGEIKLRAFVSLAGYANSQTSVGYAYSYTKGSKTVNVSKTIAFSELAASGSNYTFDIPVESACITAPITVTINYADGQAAGDPVTIEKYIKAVIDGDYPTKVKDVAWALHAFGAVAMLQFDINRNDPALKPASWEIDGNVYNPAQAPKYEIGEGSAYTPANDHAGAFYGASVSFLSKTEVNMYFKKSVLGDTAPAMTVTYSGGSSETINATVNGNYYVYTVKGPAGDGFAAGLFDVPFSFSVGTTSGEYSINTYLQLVEYKYHGQNDNILLILCEKYYDFAKKVQQV